MEIPYNYIEAKNEKELRDKLLKIYSVSGYAYKIINIYPKGKKIVAWYYASKR
jgi:DNA-directed RNA polymerase subunit F